MTVSQIDSFVSALKLFKEPVFHPAKASVYEELESGLRNTTAKTLHWRALRPRATPTKPKRNSIVCALVLID